MKPIGVSTCCSVPDKPPNLDSLTGMFDFADIDGSSSDKKTIILGLGEYLALRGENENGVFDTEEVLQFVQTYLPRKDDWISIKDRVVMNNERVKFLAKISVEISVEKKQVYFALPDYGLTCKDTIIEGEVWDNCRDDLFHGETWGSALIDRFHGFIKGWNIPRICLAEYLEIDVDELLAKIEDFKLQGCTLFD